MKKLWKILVIVIVIISVYNGFSFLKERYEEQQKIEKRKKELELLRQKENEEERQTRLKEEQEIIDPNSPVSQTPSPETEKTQHLPPPRSTVNHRYEIKTICERCRCNLLTYNEQGHAIYIEVIGPDHSAISDILPELIKAGVVNFTEHREKFGAKMINGKRVYTAAYTLRW